MINIGVIGCGHWGPNHIRIFSQLPESNVLMCADLDEKNFDKIKEFFPNVITTTNYKDILDNKNIDAVCIASPTNTHFKIAKESLDSGKHVLCEKPLSLNIEECAVLRDSAKEKHKIFMVGHVFLFNAGIVWLKEYIDSGELGKIYYVHASRTNLGPFRYDVNALWDLAPHDISIFNYLLDACPISVSARGQKLLGNSLDDVAFATLDYPDNIIASIHVSWLDPKKIRQMTIVGDKKMIVWDDLDNVGPIKIYDKHVEKTSTFYSTYGEFQLLSREGSITIPKVGFNEPLKTQAQHFISCIEKGENSSLSNAQKGLDVVNVLCATQQSIEKKGECVMINNNIE